MSSIEVSAGTEIKKADFIYKKIFTSMEHNYLCALCKEESAVQECHTGILQPCWKCMKRGYRIVKLNWFTKLFFK